MFRFPGWPSPFGKGNQDFFYYHQSVKGFISAGTIGLYPYTSIMIPAGKCLYMESQY
jgi:hypothetical protein